MKIGHGSVKSMSSLCEEYTIPWSKANGLHRTLYLPTVVIKHIFSLKEYSLPCPFNVLLPY